MGPEGLYICKRGSHPQLSDLHADRLVDFLELFQGPHGFGPPDRGWQPLGAIGRPCATAREGTCLSRLRNRTEDDSQRRHSLNGSDYLLFTRGDDIGEINTLQELLSFLGPIDTPYEAALVAWASAYDVDCTDLSHGTDHIPRPVYELSGSQKTRTCPIEITDYVLRVKREGIVTVVSSKISPDSQPGVCEGRRPPGWPGPRVPRGEGLGAHFARAAEVEAASVEAFCILGGDLARHGAPRPLLDAAERAAHDEVRHARMTARVARRYGGRPKAPRPGSSTPRSLVDIALENEVEGCVRETFGAAVALWQAARARDPVVARTMRSIAADEARHAALAWAITTWAVPQLSRRERRDVAQAREQAVADLRREMRADPAPDLVELAGLPRGSEALALLGELEQARRSAL
jgi:hypothetical protein